MPIGAQPPGRRGTSDQPYSPLNLRLVLALFGLVVCTVLAVLLFRWGYRVPGWILAAWALAALVDAGLGERLTDADARVVRALLDLDTWRALRDQGVTGEHAVETTAGMLDAWLARRRRAGAATAAA